MAIIKEIKKSGYEVIPTIIADNLTEEQALKIEAELISAFGIISQGGLLTNRVKPNVDNIKRKIKVNVPDGCYERAQMGLTFLKQAIIEFSQANPDGVTNADVAKYLGLQSSYNGGAKDYLSYSILGLLMQEGNLVRNEDKKHKYRKPYTK